MTAASIAATAGRLLVIWIVVSVGIATIWSSLRPKPAPRDEEILERYRRVQEP